MTEATRPYTVSPAVVRQRQEASRQHGLYAAPESGSVGHGPYPASPWERRKRRIRKRVESLLSQFPQLADKRLMLDAYVELEYVKAELFSQLLAGRDVGNVYDRSVSRWQQLGIQLGLLPSMFQLQSPRADAGIDALLAKDGVVGSIPPEGVS